MSDTLTINTITASNGGYSATCTLSISSTDYPATFQSNYSDAVSVLDDLVSQAEVYKQQVLSNSSIVTPTTTVASLAGESIDI